MQITIDIPDDQLPVLSDMVPRFGLKDQKELIAFSVNDFIRRYSKDPIGRAFGIWRDHNIDGVEFQNKIREEWNREYDETAL